MNRTTILILFLSGWVLAACGGSSSHLEMAHEHADDHAHEHDDDDDHAHEHDDDDDHGHGHEAPMYTELQGWLDMRMAFDEMPPMPEPPAGMTVSVGVPMSARWSGDIDGTMNPSHPEFSDPEIALYLDEHATMHGNVTVESSETNDRELVHHLDAFNVTGSSFASPDDHENRMTGTFYGDEHETHGTVIGTVNTQIVIGTYRAEHSDHAH